VAEVGRRAGRRHDQAAHRRQGLGRPSIRGWRNWRWIGSVLPDLDCACRDRRANPTLHNQEGLQRFREVHPVVEG